LSGLAKDLGSAAVMFSFGLLGLSWLLVLFF
jgi:diacylglycerol kinase